MFNMDLQLEHSPKTVKLIDFDTCQEWTPQTPKSCRFVGTPGYIAPEALQGQMSPQSDLWSVGRPDREMFRGMKALLYIYICYYMLSSLSSI